MADTLTSLGSMSIGATIPGVMASVAIGEADLTGRIEGLANFTPAAVTLASQIDAAKHILADLQASLALGLTPPSIDAQIAAMASSIAAIKPNLDILAGFYSLCAAAGVEAFIYDGSAAGLGTTLAAALAAGLPSGGGPATHANAIVLATAVSATAGAMAQVFVT